MGDDWTVLEWLLKRGYFYGWMDDGWEDEWVESARLMVGQKKGKKGVFWLLHGQMGGQMGGQNTEKTNGFKWV